MVNYKLVLGIVLVGAFFFAGGGKFVSPAISRTKVALFEAKTILTDTAAQIKSKTKENPNE